MKTLNPVVVLLASWLAALPLARAAQTTPAQGTTTNQASATATAKVTVTTPSNTPDPDEVQLFDGRSLKGWRKSDFTGSGTVQVQEGKIVLGSGYMTGITWTNDVPKMDYEVSLEAMRVEGADFFCGLTFPVRESAASLIVGGWGGGVVGISSLDYMDAANNETTKFMQFESNRWYKIRVRVQPERLQAWIDDKQIVDVNTKDRKISIRAECEPSRPLGVATYATTAALRNLKIRYL